MHVSRLYDIKILWQHNIPMNFYSIVNRMEDDKRN